MADWLIVAADFVATGGMDVGNLHLARHLAAHGGAELVSHRVDAALAATPGVSVTAVRRPFGKTALGEPFLRREGLRRAKAVLAAGGRVVVNGGNCPAPDVNWVHYVHAAFTPVSASSPLHRLKTALYHRKCLRDERTALNAARLVVCNSRLTARHVVEHCGVPEAKTVVIYFATEPERLGPVTPQERTAKRAELGWGDRPVALFVGALGDRRKGFDKLFEAWTTLCKDPNWDADLAVIGRGAELDAWRRRARDAGVAERIRFLGFRSDVPEVLAACDAMVHPARYEAYGLGVHEAVCRGLPAVASASAGVAEVLAGTLDDLLLPDPEDAAALAIRLRVWRRNLEGYRGRTAPLADRLRARTWAMMAAELRAAAERIGPPANS